MWNKASLPDAKDLCLGLSSEAGAAGCHSGGAPYLRVTRVGLVGWKGGGAPHPPRSPQTRPGLPRSFKEAA